MDALNSPGFDASKLSGERLARMKACAEKARGAFPPRLGPCRSRARSRRPVSSLPRARALGARAPAARAARSGMRGAVRAGLADGGGDRRQELGGADGFFTLCGLHYCNLFANPRMAVLFDTRRPTAAASAMDHGATRAPPARARRGRAANSARARTGLGARARARARARPRKASASPRR